MSPNETSTIKFQPDSSRDALLFRQFAEFLLARQTLDAALRANDAGQIRPALRSSAVCFFELVQELLPETPEAILRELTKVVVLNTARPGCRARDAHGLTRTSTD